MRWWKLSITHFDRLDSLRLRRRPVYEPAETAILKRELKAGQTFIDIGAHIGYYTLLASSLVGETGVVFAFEPSPENFGVLKNNIRAAGSNNIFPVDQAVSGKTGSTLLYLNPKNTGDNRLFNPGVQEWQKIQVQTTRLDDFFSAYSGRIDFIKCDAQGHELSIIRGAAETLSRFPKVKMLVEFFPLGIKQNGDDPETLLAELKGLGFRTEYPAREVIARCLPENGKHCNLFLTR